MPAPSTHSSSMTADDRAALLRVAMESVRHGLDYRKPLPVDSEGNAIQPADGSSEWLVYSYVGDQRLTRGGSSDPFPMTFNSGGNMTFPTGAVTFDNFTPRTSVISQPLTMDYRGSSQSGSIFSVNSRTQDGKAVGLLSGVSVGVSMRVMTVAWPLVLNLPYSAAKSTVTVSAGTQRNAMRPV